jgi:Flp pilus assembly protein TadB
MTIVTLAPAVLAAWCAVVLFGDPRRTETRARLRRLAAAQASSSPGHASRSMAAARGDASSSGRAVGGRPQPMSESRIRGAALAAGLALVLVQPSPTTVLIAGLGLVVGPMLLRRFEPAAHRRWRERCERDLPMALDLLAACLSSGASWASAVRVVADAIGGPLGAELTAIAVRLDLGADPVAVWRTFGPGERLQRVGVAVARSVRSGAATSSTLESLAAEQRDAARRAGEAAARRVAVRIAAPLGLCFLPAFVLLAIVPAVIGALTPLTSP